MRVTTRVIVFALSALPTASWAQAGVPALTLGAPQFTTGDLELHRVRGAGLLTDGRVAIANAGSFNVLIVNRRGVIDKRFGREGSGPGDFSGLDFLTTFGDTIVTWDGMLHRITLWRPAGTVIRSFYLQSPRKQGGVVSLESMASPSSYTATFRTYPPQAMNGLYLNHVSLFAMDGVNETDLGEQPWSHSYFYAEGNGTSTYSTPFLGTSLVATAAGKTVTLLLGETRVVFLHSDGTRGELSLPIKSVTGRERAKAYADSMIGAQKDPDPRWVKRFRAMFGSDFPVVERQAVAQRAVTVGRSVWFQEFPQAQDSLITWWIADARRETLVGRVALPSAAVVLGGTDQQVLVRLMDPDGVQSVAIFSFPKPQPR